MTLSEAAEFAGRWAETQRGMVAVAEVLKTLGPIEQAIGERQAALDTVTQAHEAVLIELQEAQARLVSLHDHHAEKSDAHAAELSQTVAITEAQAAQIIVDAERQAAEVVEVAHAAFRQAQSEHARSMIEMNQQLEMIKRSVADAQKAHEATLVEHDAVAKRMERLKAAARSILT